jgi:SNF2 family DNA or RNA helicase
MQIVNNRALLLTTRKADQITALIPRSKILDRVGDRARVLVNWGEDEAKILRNLRIKNVPHPMLRDYKWPGIYSPFAHQRETSAFLATHPRAFVLSEAGTGKSASVAWAADYLMNRGYVKRVLIVCPVSIMDTAWRADLFRTVMHRTVAIASGERAKRIRVIEGDYEFVIINYDGVKVVRKELEAAGFDLIVCDEANSIKSVSTDRWKAVASLVRPTTRVWLMTGTPAAQSPVDAYGLAKLVNPDAVPKFLGAFRDQVLVKVSQFRWIPRLDAQEVVHRALRPAIRFTKEECLDLPDMLYTTRNVPLTPQQKRYYEDIRTQMIALAGEEQITAVNAAGKLNKLLQLSQGTAYTDTGEVVDFDIKNRLKELLDVIEQTTHKVIVFVPYRHVLQRLEEELAKEKITTASIHGGTPATQRATSIKAFQTEDNPKVIMLVPQAAAHGITLTRADTVVWWGPVTSAELYMQGNARAHRAGQRNPVTIVRLQGSPVERRLYKMLDEKIDFHQAIAQLFHEESLDTET